MSINVINIVGNIWGAPEIKYFESGTVKATFSVAVNEYNKEKKEEKVHWLPCEIWGKQAEFIAEYGKSGSRVAVEGCLLTSTYADSEGQNKKRFYIKVRKVELMSKK